MTAATAPRTTARHRTYAEENPVTVNALEVDRLAKSYGKGASTKQILKEINVSVAKGELACIVGPSGAGKTTLLRCLAGLQPPTSGTVSVDGQEIDGVPDNLAVVFQDYSRSLFPWLRVAANVEFPLLEKKMPKAERAALVDQMLAAVGLSAHANKYPRELSGGMQQRVAIARALAYRPTILLMDEPFAALDAQTRADLEDTVLKLRDEFGVTIVFVTHDIDEAVYLGDKVVVLSGAPATVDEIVEVKLPSPRNQVDTKAEPEYGRLRGEVFKRIANAQHNN
ncbi:ABC transporter ATP-binding protein [Tomitella fengzijianii]|uniref:ABC transporter ATP-binding protein n=1 Tax=Tomitella fengzijianii TaxID=2597660 RepID=A0A516WZ06_9ACTN|nr:ABC transporter ATP-binding protein [Tomitella fengzijianii]